MVTKQSMVDRGDVAPALRSLEDGGVPFVLYGGILPDAPIGLVDDAVELLTASGCDMVIGLGGGSAMDIAKCVAVAATNDVPVRDMLGHGRVPRPGLPTIVVSTTHVAGADTGSAAVLQIDEQTHAHGVVDSPYLLADVVINDPELTLTMTPEATVDTCVDTLVTGIECLTGRQANPLADLYSESILRICAAYLPAVVADGKDREARYNLALAASMGGWAYMSSFIGAVHGASYGVAAVCGLTHGRSMAAILPAVMRYNLPASPGAFRRIAEIFGRPTGGLADEAAGALAVDAVEELLDRVGVAHRLRDYGLRARPDPRGGGPLVGPDRRLPRVQRTPLRQAGRRVDPRRCVLRCGPSIRRLAQWPYQDGAPRVMACRCLRRGLNDRQPHANDNELSLRVLAKY